jgi:hypothetical protein
MTEQTRRDIDHLFAPLPADQQALLQIIGDAVLANRTWPIYQYVEANLDELDYDAGVVFGRLPVLANGYGPAWRDRTGHEKEPVKLTIAGMAHLPAFASTVDMFLRVVRELADQRVKAAFDPTRVITVEVPGRQLIETLHLADEPLVDLLPDLLHGEPSTWNGAGGTNEDGWFHQPSTFIRRFRTVTDVNDYLTRMRDWLAPAAPTPAPEPASPLGLVTAFDYLDVVWRLRFGRKLVHVPSTERAAKLVFEVSSPDEFTDRLSALGEMLKALDVPGSPDAGPFERLRTYLPAHLSAEAMARVTTALDLLQKVTHLRNAGQHVGAAGKAARALPAFGLSYPITSYQAAWWAVQAHVVAALDTIREEVQATIPAPRSSRPSSAPPRRRPAAPGSRS